MRAKPKPSILFNVQAQFLGQIAVILTQIAYVIVVTRYLDVASFGIFSFAVGVVQIVLIISDFGLNLFTTRQLAASPSESRYVFQQLLSLKIALAFAFGVLLILGGKLWLEAETLKVLALFTGGMVLHSIGLSFNVSFQGHGDLYIGSAMTFLLVFLQLLLGTGFLIAGGGILSLGTAYVASSAVALVASYFLYTGRIHDIDLALSFKSIRPFMKQCVPMGLGAALGALANRADVPLVFWISGAAQLGIYAAAYRITGTLYNVPAAIFSAVLPFMSRLSWNTPAMDDTLERTFLVSVIAGSCMFLFFTIAGPAIVVSLFGNAYSASGDLLRILSWALIPSFINVGLLYASVSQKKTAFAYTVSAGVGAFVNIGLNLLWIPIWKNRGASYATVATESMMLVSYIYCLRNELKIQNFDRPFKLIGLSLSAAGLTWFASLNGIRTGILAVAIYLAFAFWIGKFSIQDRKFWMQRLAHSGSN